MIDFYFPSSSPFFHPSSLPSCLLPENNIFKKKKHFKLLRKLLMRRTNMQNEKFSVGTILKGREY